MSRPTHWSTHRCTAYCGNGLHATVVAAARQVGARGLRQMLQARCGTASGALVYPLRGVGPCLVVDLFPAREWQPDAALPYHIYAWVLLVQPLACADVAV